MKPKLLWIDDDPITRFEDERNILEAEGLDVYWAVNVAQARKKLETEEFQIIILDQMLPIYWEHGKSEIEKPDLWAGCCILAWLMGKDVKQIPFTNIYKVFKGANPKPGNSRAHIIALTARQDPEVLRTLDKLKWNIPFLVKPIDDFRFTEEIRKALKKLDES